MQLRHLNLASGEVRGFQCRIQREPAIQVRPDLQPTRCMQVCQPSAAALLQGLKGWLRTCPHSLTWTPHTSRLAGQSILTSISVVQISADGWFAATHERFTVKVWRPDKPALRTMNLDATKRISVRCPTSSLLLPWLELLHLM